MAARDAMRAGLSGFGQALGISIFDGLYPFELNSAIVKVGGESRAVTVAELSRGLLQTLGVSPIRGREFASDEYVPGNAAVIVSEELWRSMQSVAPSADDHAIRVDGVRQTIVGVMPAGFESPVSRVSRSSKRRRPDRALRVAHENGCRRTSKSCRSSL